MVVRWGEEGDRLQNLARRLGVADQVTLLDDPSAAMQVLASADVFAFPSRWEGLGIAVLEAMAFSLPCVVPRMRPLTEMIADRKNGLHFEPESTRGLAAALDSLVRDRDLRDNLGRSRTGRVRLGSGGAGLTRRDT